MGEIVTLGQLVLTTRQDNWHIRVAVPADVRTALGSRALQKSLHTTSMDIAAERARFILVQWQAEFDAARQNSGLGWRPAANSNENVLAFPGRRRA